VHFVLPVHLNPSVREIVLKELGTIAQIHLFSPLGYADLLEVIRRSAFVLTDSGGIQEECPSLRKAVLVLRRTTERPEVVDAGFGRLVGTDRDAIVSIASRLLEEPGALAAMTAGENPFGDGRAALRIAELLRARLAASAAGASEGAEKRVSVA
jgi:UDP-N-acetylglucosamine 2-epimerase (non-hydrolysing)